MKIPVQGEKILYQMKKTKSGLKQLFVPGMFFEDMGITYLGPVDGHDIRKLYKTFQEAKRVDHAVLVQCTHQERKGIQVLRRRIHPDFTGSFRLTLRPGRQKRRALRTAIPIFFPKYSVILQSKMMQ